MNERKQHIIVCSGAPVPRKYKGVNYKLHKFDCRPGSKNQNVKVELPHLVRVVGCHFPDKTKDLLEIASYVYAADRMITRGSPDALEFQSWSRSMKFIIPVRDHDFWKRTTAVAPLVEALTFMSGDLSYEFEFVAGGADSGQLVLTDHESITLEEKNNSHVCLFSGGLDSLAGALQNLSSGRNLILVSHRSSNPGVYTIQEAISKRLIADFPGRIQYFHFTCNLTAGHRAVEETQRTRVFLYTAIACSLLGISSEPVINVFENGITSLNLPKRQDAINSRASRTTHPKTIHLLQEFYSEFSGSKVVINHPFLYKTKSDVVEIINSAGKAGYINSTLTCTKTFSRFENRTKASHCGRCSQCVDRRFAMYATELEDYDALYDIDIARDSISDQEGFTHLLDYLYLKSKLEKHTPASFWNEFASELVDIIPHISGTDHNHCQQSIFDLTQRHVDRIDKAVKRIREGENLSKPRKKDSIFKVLDERLYLKDPRALRAKEVKKILERQIPIAFQTQKPNNERALNDLIQAILSNEKFDREFPVLIFASAKTVPDHSSENLFIEAKYPRANASQASITDEIAADITKYRDAFKMFAVYDPLGKIVDKTKFKKAIEGYPNCMLSYIQ